ncbi:MAG: winged helix-turn-helix domain-containing protein [Promethearchaeota archaeon]
MESLELREGEKIIINLLEKEDLSYTEIQERRRDKLSSGTSLSKYLKNLKKLNLIEDYKTPDSRYRSKYRLTEEYHNIKKRDFKKNRINQWMEDRTDWQIILNLLQRHLETHYPNVLQEYPNFKLRDFVIDIYSYMKYFQFDVKLLYSEFQYYINLVIYLIINHPDGKYNRFKDIFKLSIFSFNDVINQLKINEQLESFSYKENQNNQLIIDDSINYFLITEDPILNLFKKEIETLFPKFLLCWEFPNVKLEEYFSFLLQFSYSILSNSYEIVIRSKKEPLIDFYQRFKSCLIIYIREYIFSFLNILRLKSDKAEVENRPPLELLPAKEKIEYREKLLVSSISLPNSIKKSIESFFVSQKSLDKEIIKHLISIIKKLAQDIEDKFNSSDLIQSSELIYKKSHLMFLLRVFHKLDNKLYKKFQNDTITDFPNLRMSYSYLSDNIFETIIKYNIGVEKEDDYLKSSFVIRNFFERIRHLSNLIKLEGNQPHIIQKFKEIFNLVEKNFSQKINIQFLKQKINIFLEGVQIETREDIYMLINRLVELDNKDLDLGKLAMQYYVKYKDLDEFNTIFKKFQLSLKEKIKILENFIETIPLDFDLFNFLDIEKSYDREFFLKEDIQNKIKIQTDLEYFRLLLKELAIFYERKKNYQAAMTYYFLGSLDNNPDIQKTPDVKISNKSWLKKPMALNFIQLYLKNKDEDRHFKIENPEIIKLIYEPRKEFIETNNIVEEISEFDEEIPYLINIFIKIYLFQEISLKNPKYKDLVFKIIKKIDHLTGITSKVTKDSEKTDEEIYLLNILAIVGRFKKFQYFKFLGIQLQVQFYLQNIKNSDSSEIIPKYLEPSPYAEPLFNLNIVGNLYRSPYNSLLNKSLESKNIIPLVTLMHQINQLEIKKKEFTRLRIIFRELDPEKIYHKKGFPFEIAFSWQYNIPKEWKKEKWKSVIKQVNNFPLIEIELMDLYLYHDGDYIDFEILENLCLNLLKIYGINWAERYLDQYIDYLIWYSDRVETFRLFEEIEDFDLIQKIFNFIRYLIKAILYWEYRERTRVKENTSIATDYYKIIKSHNLLIFEIKIFQKYKSTLKNLQNIL